MEHARVHIIETVNRKAKIHVILHVSRRRHSTEYKYKHWTYFKYELCARAYAQCTIFLCENRHVQWYSTVDGTQLLNENLTFGSDPHYVLKWESFHLTTANVYVVFLLLLFFHIHNRIWSTHKKLNITDFTHPSISTSKQLAGLHYIDTTNIELCCCIDSSRLVDRQHILFSCCIF